MSSGRLLIGLILVLFGLNALLQQTGFGEMFWFGDIFSTFWPLILIAFGISALGQRNTGWGLILVTLGAVFQFSRLFDVNVGQLIWPLILIGAGAFILFRDSLNLGSRGVVFGTDDREYFDESIFFWGLEKKALSKNFRGGRITCFFGGTEIDLTEVVLRPEGATLEINCGFGGVEIYVPKTMRVQSNGDSILAGWEVYIPEQPSEGPVLTIKGSAMFGGVEIKQK